MPCPLRKISVVDRRRFLLISLMISLDTAYRSFGGEVEASSTPTICRLPDSRRHQLSAIARPGPGRTTAEPASPEKSSMPRNSAAVRVGFLCDARSIVRSERVQ